jgi:chemotaxis response regulator CheB
MPELDGISALPQLLAKKRDLIIIMASTLTRRNAEISFKALSLGASDYIPKPESTREATAAETFRHDLIQKIRHLGAKVRRAASPSLAPTLDRAREASARSPVAPSVQHAGPARAPDRFVDRWSAGADGAGRRDRTGDRSFSGADHPAHAADLHHDSRRASGAQQPEAGA